MEANHIEPVSELDLVRRAAYQRTEQRLLIAELRSVGVYAENVWDLVNRRNEGYESAIEILGRHLRLKYSDSTREGIARALAVPKARHFWPMFVDEYINAPEGEDYISPGERQRFRFRLKDGLAVALAATLVRPKIAEALELVRNRRHGTSRVLLLRGLRRFRDPTISETLEELKDDPDLHVMIAEYAKVRNRRKNRN